MVGLGTVLLFTGSSPVRVSLRGVLGHPDIHVEAKTLEINISGAITPENRGKTEITYLRRRVKYLIVFVQVLV